MLVRNPFGACSLDGFIDHTLSKSEIQPNIAISESDGFECRSQFLKLCQFLGNRRLRFQERLYTSQLVVGKDFVQVARKQLID